MSGKGKKEEYSKNQETPAYVREGAPAYDTPKWKRQGEYTLDDYYALPDDQPVEIIDGVIYDMNAPFLVHQDLALLIYRQLADQIDKKGGPCRVNLAAVDIVLGEDRKTVVQPDVFIVCDTSKRKKWGIQGAPDFILEILSPSTRRKDMTVKYEKYKKSGVREYWMLDEEGCRMIICDLENGSGDRIQPLAGKAGLLIYNGEIVLDLDPLAAQIKEGPL